MDDYCALPSVLLCPSVLAHPHVPLLVGVGQGESKFDGSITVDRTPRLQDYGRGRNWTGPWFREYESRMDAYIEDSMLKNEESMGGSWVRLVAQELVLPRLLGLAEETPPGEFPPTFGDHSKVGSIKTSSGDRLAQIQETVRCVEILGKVLCFVGFMQWRKDDTGVAVAPRRVTCSSYMTA